LLVKIVQTAARMFVEIYSLGKRPVPKIPAHGELILQV
jgi:hypothetical protein